MVEEIPETGKSIVSVTDRSAGSAENDDATEQNFTSETDKNSEFAGASAEHVTFAYESETILDDYSLKLEAGKITGIHGASGSGKSTLLNY